MKKRKCVHYQWDNEMFKTMTDKAISKQTGIPEVKVSKRRWYLVKYKNKDYINGTNQVPKVNKTKSTTNISGNTHIKVGNINLYIHNSCKNVYVDKNKVEINF